MAPGDRVIDSHEDPQLLKFDLRLYACHGAVQWTVDRGANVPKANNEFSHCKGGFAPVYSLPDVEIMSEIEGIEISPEVAVACCLQNCA